MFYFPKQTYDNIYMQYFAMIYLAVENLMVIISSSAIATIVAENS